MQAIILAAGLGRRLGKLTSDRTKCMVEVNGTTLIERLLGQLAKKDLTKVIIVIGYEGQKVKSLIGDEFNGLDIEYIENPIYDQTNNIYSLYLAKECLLEEDTLLLESDLILDEQILDKVLSNPLPNLAVIDKYQSWMDGTVVEIDKDNNIISFIPKKNFKFTDIHSYYKTVNVYKFSKEFANSHYIPFLEAYSKALGRNEYYEQVLRVITLLEKPNIKALPLDGEAWYEIDDIQDLDNAETIFTDETNKLDSIKKRYGGYWRYPKLIDFCYLVNPYFPPQKMIEEIKTSFTTLLTQYPSGSSVNNLLAAKCFEIDPRYVIVGNGAAELINAYLSNTDLVNGIILPTFEEYNNRIKDQNKIIYYKPANDDFSYTIDDLIHFYSENKIEQLILINPDNPTGNFISKFDLLRLLNWTETQNIRLILDESFVDFSVDAPDVSLLDNEIISKYPNLVIVKSISKSYGVPGLRLGILATCNQEVLGVVKSEISIWNINSFAEFYMQIYNKYEADYLKACELFKEERDRFFKELYKIDFLTVYPSQANYFLCKLNNGDSKKLTETLLTQYGLLIKDCSGKKGFENGNHIRIAIRGQKDNNRLIEAIKSLNF